MSAGLPHGRCPGSIQRKCDKPKPMKLASTTGDFAGYAKTTADAVMQGLLAIGYKGYFTFEAGNMLLSYGRWPHRRRQAPSVTERRLSIPSLELRRKAASLLYEIGRAILTAYDCFEE